MRKLLSSFGTFIFLFAVISCNTDEPKKFKEDFTDSIKTEKDTIIEIVEDPYPFITYTLDTIKNFKHLREIRKRFGNRKGNKTAYKIFVTLNRKEMRFVRVGTAVVIPDSLYDDIKAYSIFPDIYPGAKQIPKLVMVSTVYQSYGCYEYGKLVRFAAVNTGKERTPTFPGRYSMNWREKVHHSSIDSNWIMPYTLNFHLEAGSAFHQFTMPGKPASHSCVRQFIDDAEWLYYWVDLIKTDENKKIIRMSGTPVIIIDYYDFRPRYGYKWKYLKNNKFKIDYLPPDPMSVEEAIIPISQIPLASRGSLVNYSRYLYGEDTLRARGIIRPGVRLIVTRNFNKERREKEKAEAERLEQLRQDSIQRIQIIPDSIKRALPHTPDSGNSEMPDTLTIIK